MQKNAIFKYGNLDNQQIFVSFLDEQNTKYKMVERMLFGQSTLPHFLNEKKWKKSRVLCSSISKEGVSAANNVNDSLVEVSRDPHLHVLLPATINIKFASEMLFYILSSFQFYVLRHPSEPKKT